MTMVARVGWEWGTATEEPNITLTGSGISVSTTQKRQGAYSLYQQTNGNGDWNTACQLSISALSELYIQWGIYINSAIIGATARQVFAWRNGSAVLGGIKTNVVTGAYDVYTGNFATLIGSIPMTIGSWQVIELRIKIADSGGIIQARKDMGGLLVNYSGDTKPGSETAVDNFRWGTHTLVVNGDSTYIDDIIVNSPAGSYNNSWPGGLRIIRQAPTGDVGSPQFTPTPSGAHWSTVDEVPPSGTDNLISATAAQEDELTLADCPADVHSIAAVDLVAFALKGSSNPPTQLKMGLKLGGISHYTANQALAVSQGVVKELWETNPATGNPMTPSELNAATLLVQSVT